MSCYHPLKAWRDRLGFVTFDGSKGIGSSFSVPCGQCVGCRLERSRQWAVRIMHESKLHELNAFLTLTYDDEHLPPDRGLKRKHVQLFLKRLRKCIYPKKIRYFYCGEYGSEGGRPHYHMILFGHNFYNDRKLILAREGTPPFFSSKMLDGLWKMGDCRIGDVTFETAQYVAKYCMERVTGDLANYAMEDGCPGRYSRPDPETGEIFFVEREFIGCSSKPGIGFNFYEKFESDFRGRDVCIVDGRESKIPRYYDKIYERKVEQDKIETLKLARIRRANKRKADNSSERLKVREKVVRARLNLNRSRDYENV